MNAGSKLGAFGLVLAAAFGLGALAGNVVGPIDTSADHPDGEERPASGAGAEHEPAGGPASGTATATVDGYGVTLSGTPTAGAASELTLTVRRDGRPVTDLDPYLGAFGHLVAIRGGDLAYLHVHPLGGEPGEDDTDGIDDAGGDRGGPEVAFAVEVPSPGDYRLFFDFSHGGTVRTAAFTVHVPAGEHGASGDHTATTTATGAEEGHG